VPLFVNAKFTLQATTGVQRVAAETLRVLDEALPGRFLRLRPAAGRPSHAWEQLVLPWQARQGWLLNLAGAAPALGRRQLCLIHDAAVFDHPEAYTPAFRIWYRALFRHLARSEALLATVSAFSRRRLAACLGVPEARFHLLPNGADHLQRTAPDPGTLQRLGLTPGGYLLALGSANPTKNFGALTRAYARLAAAPALPLVLVGGEHRRVFAGGPPADAPGVLRTGSLGDAALKALYEGALAFVFPSLYEGFGLPPLEAMSCGCPVAAADAAALPEVCGDAALYFDPRSEASIAAALARLVGDASLRQRLRAAGRQRAAGYAWQAAGERLLGVLRQAGAL